MPVPEQLSDQINGSQYEESGDVIADLITQERTHKLDLLIHLITNLKQSLIVCGPKGIGKTTLLTVFQEHYASVWPIVFLSATEHLSFEQIQVQLLKRLAQPGSGNVAQRLNILLRGLENFNRAVVLVCDDAGLMSPGLMTTLMQYSTEFPGLRIVFALTDDELVVKHSEDPAIDSCYFIEIPALSETQCGEFLQYLSVQLDVAGSLGDRDVKPGLKKVPEINRVIIQQLYNQTKGIPGRIAEALPDVMKTGGVKGFNWLRAALITGGLTLGAVFWLFNNPAPVSEQSPVVTQMLAAAPLAIPGQTIPTPEPAVAESVSVAAVNKLNKPLLPVMRHEADFYKGHGRSLEGDALTEFELINNEQTAIEAFESEQLKVEIIPPDPVKPELSVAIKEPSPNDIAMAGDAQAMVIDTKPMLNVRPETVATSVHNTSAVIAAKQKIPVIKKTAIVKPSVEKTKPSKPTQAVAAEAKTQSEQLLKLELAKKPKLKILEKIKPISTNLAAAQGDHLKPVPVASKVNVVGAENVAAIEPPKSQPVKEAKPLVQADTPPNVAAQTKLKAIKDNTPVEVASVKPSSSRYTLQLMSFTQQALLADFMRKHSAMGSNLRTIKINKDGSEKYLVVYGTFESNAQANAAKQKLPAEFSQAWPRKM